MVLLWLLFLCDWASAQDCSSLQHDSGQHHGVIFGDVDAAGTALGNLAIGGNANFEQFSAGGSLPSDSDWAILVQGDITFQCGDVGGQVFHGGHIDIGARVDWQGYGADNANIGSLYQFSSAESYYLDLSTKLSEVDRRGFGGTALHIATLVLSGTGRSNEMFYVSCNDLIRARSISFANLNRDDTTTVIINVAHGDAPQCAMDVAVNRYAGLHWREPTGHILWNFFDTTDLTLSGSIVGSVLAPRANVRADEAHVEGQVVFNSLAGKFFFGANLFRGCIPTDPCTLAREACPVVLPPTDCIDPQPVMNPDDACCVLTHECAESCDDFVCPAVQLSCTGRFVPKLSVVKGQPGADPCCDTWACLNQDDTITTNDPLSVFCPDDQEVTLGAGLTSAAVSWREPEFLYVESVSRSHTSPSVFNAGEHVVAYTANGYKDGTSVGCYFAIIVREATVVSGGCNVGGVTYDVDEPFLDDCMRQCVCGDAGVGVGCTRLRKELSTMNLDERARYWSTYKAAYNAPDDVIRNHVDNHLRFFSRGLHNNGAFLPWHRGYILQIENRLQQDDCRVTVPYWNWRLQVRIRNANHWGEASHQASGNGDSRRCVSTGTFGHSNGFSLTSGTCLQRRLGGGAAASQPTVESQLMQRYSSADRYEAFRNRLEHGPGLHDSVHCLVGGTMCSARASNDPIFFSHHANIDKIWSEWQSLGDAHQNFYSGSTGRHDLLPTSPWTPDQLLLLSNQPGGVRVHYHVLGEVSELVQAIGSMTPDELLQIGNSGVGPVGDQWLHDMNMDQQDIDVIRLAEELANSNVVEDAVAMTMRNSIERTIEAPGLLRAIKQVATRTAIHLGPAGSVETVTADALFRALTETFIESNVVPRFLELQDIILTSDDGEVVDIVSDPVPILCAADPNQVCANGQSFANACEAAQAGHDGIDNFGPCPIPSDPLPPVDPAIDGGASDDYNHGSQELQECPPTTPSHLSYCPVDGVTCYYGLNCCEMNEFTATCVDEIWRIAGTDWHSCEDVIGCGDAPVEQSGASVQISTRPPTPAVTRAPTRSPTRWPTRSPTGRPTRSPTRSRTISRPSTPVPRPPPVPQPSSPRPPTTTSLPRSASQSITRSSTRPQFTVPASSFDRSPPPRPPPLVIRPPICPSVDCPRDAPVCCPPGSRLERPDIRNSNGEVCARGCLTCLSNQRPVQIPACCATMQSCDGPPSCSPPLVAQIIRPRGPNNQMPCCDRYECVEPCSNVVCPTLANTICQPWEVPAWVSDWPDEARTRLISEFSDPAECCPNILCVFSQCEPGSRTCPDGSIVERVATSSPPCRFANCPPSCQQPTQQLFCPSSGGQIPRGRNPPSHSPESEACDWLPCPPYEPCDDPIFDGHCQNGANCIRGRETIACECIDGFTGPRCATAPQRRTFPIFTRSFMVFDQCLLIMCASAGCFLSTDFGLNWDLILVSGLDASIVSYHGYWNGRGHYFVSSEGNLVHFNVNTNEFSWGDGAESRFEQHFPDALDNQLFTPAFTEFSYVELEAGKFPPASEVRHVIRTDACEPNYIFMTESSIIAYLPETDKQIVTPWSGDNLVSEEFELCPDLCVNDDGERNTCSGNGICVRETGECVCNFGYRGPTCNSEFGPNWSNVETDPNAE